MFKKKASHVQSSALGLVFRGSSSAKRERSDFSLLAMLLHVTGLRSHLNYHKGT